MRLFVDSTTGAIVGRQRIGAPETYARLERPAPGFGWTEDDAAPRRVIRPVPQEEGPALRLQRRPTNEALRPDGNPDGLNPDGIVRTPPPRKVARAVPPRPTDVKPTHRTSPEAPTPQIAPAEAAKLDPKPASGTDTKAAAIEKAAPPAPAPNTSAPVASKPAEAVVAETAKPPAKDWKDPPASDKKHVRVIGGATIVPGTAE
ncbi:hypothetical protein [Methylobacterium sp. P5_C11]